MKTRHGSEENYMELLFHLRRVAKLSMVKDSNTSYARSINSFLKLSLNLHVLTYEFENTISALKYVK